jgi:hypothetical protein
MWLAEVVPMHSTSPRSLPVCVPSSSLDSSVSGSARNAASVIAAHSATIDE